ncbi:phosphotransferase enzyme family protein [Paenibacillus sp. GXUN7292]|uniref:phosphotransferase enzyme family protein n=1 Tax=Paenibacillus sp. GXUN7292 TaxID=3422499 RepID=UPI003D7D0C95
MDKMKHLLKVKYDLEAAKIVPQHGGWAALAFKVYSSDGSFFLKFYEKSRASTPKWTALIDQYVPITVWLMHNSQLRGRLPVPVLTQNGDYKCEDDEGIYLLYEYIEGETVGDKELTGDQVEELSKMIAELHLYGEEIPVETKAIKEDFAVPFLAQMRTVVDQAIDELPYEVRELIQSHMAQLMKLMDSIEKLSADLMKRNLKMTLCHTDLHNWNLMQSSSRQLMLIDWEGLKLAPVEADLMFFIDKPYYHAFMTNYRKVHNEFAINPDVLQFYQDRRKLEDIWEFIEQILFDRQDAQERAETISHLSRELREINS